jgi:preprotein translocase subunit Sec63
MDMNKVYYAILGVMPTAEFETIQAVYRALSKKYHPDVSQQDKTKSEEKTREINEAYEILSDVSKKKSTTRREIIQNHIIVISMKKMLIRKPPHNIMIQKYQKISKGLQISKT